jgi:hypothetical protein
MRQALSCKSLVYAICGFTPFLKRYASPTQRWIVFPHGTGNVLRNFLATLGSYCILGSVPQYDEPPPTIYGKVCSYAGFLR